MKVCELERSLFDAFPKEDAESWDHVGLSVGDPDSTVGRVLVALDATADMVMTPAPTCCSRTIQSISQHPTPLFREPVPTLRLLPLSSRRLGSV